MQKLAIVQIGPRAWLFVVKSVTQKIFRRGVFDLACLDDTNSLNKVTINQLLWWFYASNDAYIRENSLW